ncbi:thiol peroxidase [Vagococcus lutrae]|uniref:thiol peroxidase n=1 Tax=Vagococcus lutrae TaxID=81947 RepID=UPI001C96BFAA|nr:thiol peroxidase [Vagococcus lutrae]MCO7151079.1 thiol peroxidase [Vagococcus lutrae]MDT2823768.1 thiol peroxidase [Vagococcus lutrae]QZN89499.1 thiol peroxidase [Vagococcus lutrae]UQF23964.1 thiol peroxidase [Vagococcus lutrae]UQF63946.1 thiol peroxidase [Vagococcus lutrae]
MKVTLGGEAVTLVGNDLKVGDKAPDFSLNNLNNEPVQLANLLTQPVLLNVVPDIETGVCQLQTKRFNQEANKITDAKLVTISKNSREEQQNWCAGEGIDMEMLHDPELFFGREYGILIEELGIFARSIFIIDTDGKIAYVQIVPEIKQEPDYDEALTALKELINS